MKKLLPILAALALVIALVTTSCSRVTREVKWYDDFEAAKKVAAQENLNILVLVNSDMDSTDAKPGVDYLLNDQTFLNAVKDLYVCVNFDFTDLQAKMAQTPEGATDKEQKAAEKQKTAMMTKFNIADMLQVTTTPAVRLVSPEGFYIADVDFDYSAEVLDAYYTILDNHADEVKEFTAKIEKTKSGSVADRCAAVDAIYSQASEAHRLLLVPLYDVVIKADKKNETGLASKYITAKANAQSHLLILNKEIDKAVEVYEKAALDKRVTPDDRQMLYYIAANTLGNTSDPDYKKLIDLLQKSIDASPDSNYVTNLKGLLDYVKTISGISSEETDDTAEDTNATSEQGANSSEEGESADKESEPLSEDANATGTNEAENAQDATPAEGEKD